MTVDNVVWMLLGLAALIVLLTALRLGRDESGHSAIPQSVVTVHTINGVLAIVVSVLYLTDAGGLRNHGFGSLIIGLWWLEALLGLGVLARWLPGHGRHAPAVRVDGWTDGPWLSLVAHLGLVVGVALMTFFFLTDQV